MKKYVILFLSLFFFWVSSQEKETNKIDLLLKKSTKLLEYDGLKSLEYSKEASLIAEKIGDSERKAKSYLNIAKSLFDLDMYKESLNYIDKGLKEKATNENIVLKASLKEIKASDYFSLYLDDQAFAEFLSASDLISNRTDSESVKILARINANLGLIFYFKKDYKKADDYINKSLKLYTKVSSVHFDKYEYSGLYIVKGRISIQGKKQDSSIYFIQKAYDLVKKDTLHPNYRQLSAFADYYNDTKQYSKALDYYLKVIQEMEKFKIKNANYQIRVYTTIAEIYGALGDKKNQNIYLEKYITENKKFQSKNIENVQVAINTILSEKNNEISFIENRKNIWLFSIIIIFIIAFIGFYFIYNKINQKRKKTIRELEMKEAIITEKELHTNELKLKVNEAFDEIIDLAKENHPNFYTRFLEVYPDFQKKLLIINSNLQNSEMVLLAYIYLNFTTKEIADFTNKSPRTIQNRKHHLRKKLGISSSEDLYMWIKTNCM